ncbi:MAG: AI-2E family transporter [Chitinophagales bacterium]|nr:AI-2E family transporter [Chitinophagaceae bacterium]MCB9063665.1 AI-2E family transporter [Chitinophagales bacterium]
MKLLTTENLKQLGLIALILLVGVTIAYQLSSFIPGLLGAATLYILMRRYYYNLVDNRKWKKWLAATVLILGAMVVFVLPLVLLFQIFIPKFQDLLSKSGQLNEVVAALIEQIEAMNVPITVNSDQIFGLIQNASTSVPAVLGATMNFLTNAVLAFFILYFMFVQGKEMEKSIQEYLPLKGRNVDDIWKATRLMVNSNAVGIPILAASQGLVAIIGYKIFGVSSYVMWGALTGIFSVVPVVGCAIIWAPLCIYLTATGHSTEAIGLAIYSFIITGGVDNVLRFTILKKLGDVHPITTALGIIVGLPLFGFMGFIFGPLLVSYLLLLIKVYRVEFSTNGNEPEITPEE